MKKLCKNLNHTMFDVAGGPVAMAFMGFPLLIIIAVIILIWVSVVLIRKAYFKVQQNAKIHRNDNIQQNNKTEALANTETDVKKGDNINKTNSQEK